MDLPEDLDDPHVDPDYIGFDEEMEDDVDDRNIEDTKAYTNVDDDDYDHDDDDHNGDDHDDIVADRSQWHS